MVSHTWFNDIVLHSSAPIKRPVPTDAMIERRNKILGMSFGMRSLNYLLEEKKIKICGLLNKNESTDDWIIKKNPRWENVTVSRRFLPSLDKPSEPKSSARGSKRPCLVVHRFDQCPRGSQIKYTTHEHAEMILNQYGSNEHEDLSRVSVGIDDFLPTLPIFEPDLTCTINIHSSS